MITLLTDFVGELRAAGIPVSMVEAIDAMEAVKLVDIGDRSALKAALGATLVKNARHYQAFDVAFEVFFAHHRNLERDPEGTSESGGQGGGRADGQSGSQSDIDDLVEALFRAIMGEMPVPSRRRRVGRLRSWPGSNRGGQSAEPITSIAPCAGSTSMPFGRGCSRPRWPESKRTTPSTPALRAKKSKLRSRGCARRSRMRYGDDWWRTAAASRLPGLSGSHWSRTSTSCTPLAPILTDIEDVIEPLTRKLAARLARRRRLLRSGRLDFRRTVRRSLATGGVPMDPVFRKARPHRPEVFLLCDISGSMATFARFTLQFTYAMATQFSKLRSFVFIDTVDEVTRYFGPGIDFNQALGRIATEADAVWLDGHSDYGNSLDRFEERYGSEITPRTTLIITGDARNNYRPPRAEILDQVSQKARAVYWLNPEPRSYWDSGDSVMGRYSTFCDGTYEVRTLRQLEHFVEHLAVPGHLSGRRQRSPQLPSQDGR